MSDGTAATAAGGPPTQGRGLLPGIQLLRGAAAGLVIVAHADLMMRYPEYFGRSIFGAEDLGVFGVAVFFAISGFIIGIVSLDGDARPALPIGEYTRRRFVRIVPFLWLCVIGYNVLTYLGTRQVEWGPAARAMAVWPVGELKPNVVWSLRHEFLFYALFALTMLGVRQRRWLLYAWFLAPAVLWAATLPFPVATTPWHPWNVPILQVVLMGANPGANCQIGAGFLVGLAWLRGRRWTQARLPAGLPLALGAVIAGAVLISWAPLPPGLARVLLWTALSLGTLVLGVVARSESGPLRALGLALGNASFSIYLVHNPTLLVLLELSKGRTALAPPLVFLVGYVLAAAAAGVAVHHLVEKPLIAILSGRRRFFLSGLRGGATARRPG
jgi:exopolysaccharide production protein ExoZ